ncbi:MAG: type IVB secretion system protein IcmH/DotU [Ignavibacteriales bacterium]|nr:type IVB secretion system protein IcmH/DotU [Ignavibacteriales bacterium]
MNSVQQVQSSQKRKPLSDVASDCLILILQLRATNNYGNANSIKTKVTEMFDDFERNGRSSGYENEKIQQAKFALVALLDETIISSSWDQKSEWLSEPLQLKLFDTFNAGEEFFNNINSLRQRTTGNKDVLEIYYLCLVLGFKGKYQLQSPENLRRVINDLNIELHPDMYNAIDTISPNGKAKDDVIQYAKGGLPLWVYPVGAIVISTIFYAIMAMSVSGKADSVVQILNKLL